ncbi:hypothetical protein [Actinomadura hibisca]|uniref:hypothetical protein n=1 Tax=Actinomadura hibisca TaxID=68565 RepID=UPI000836F0F1|nr:hypothetical protein [Actinomadura hibisca]
MRYTLPSGFPTLEPTEPADWSEQGAGGLGSPVDARYLESDVSGAVLFHRSRPLFQGLCTGAVNVPTSTWTPLPLTEIIDAVGGHSDSANKPRWAASQTANSGDWYLCTGYVPMVATNGNRVHVAGIRLNGGTVYEGMKITGGAGHATDMLVVDLLHLAVDQYVELMAWQDTGATVATSTGTKCPSLTLRWACSATGTVVPLPALPRTWTANDLLTADSTGTVGPYTKVPLNRHVNDVLRFLRYPPAARLNSIGTTQTIPSNASGWTSIQMIGEHIDNYGGHDNTTNNTRYTCQRAGLYFVHGLAAVGEPSSSAGWRAARLLVNGTTAYTGTSTVPAAVSTSGTAVSATALIRMNAGDYVELQMQQNQGSALSVKGGAGDHSRLIAVWQSL